MSEIRTLERIHQFALRLAKPWVRKPSGPLYMTLIVADIQQFGDLTRTQQHRDAMVSGLRTALETALGKTLKEAGEKLRACTIQSQGDGALVLVPGHIPSGVILTYLPDHLSRELRTYNATRCAEAQIKLRLSVHVGPVPIKVSSDAVIHVNRLVEAEDLKSALRESPSVLGIVASEKLYHEIISQDPASNPERYREITVREKQTTTKAWIYLVS